MSKQQAKSVGTDINQMEITSLSQIQGQPQVIELLKVNIEAYLQRRQRGKTASPFGFGPCLFTGPPGTGKSMIAKAVHKELSNLKLVEVNSEMLTPTDTISILLQATDETTIFLDEAQSLNGNVQNILLTALSERKIFTSKINSKGSFEIPLSEPTIIFASTHEYQINDALRNRMRIFARFDYYSETDLISIIKQATISLGWKYESEVVLGEIAKRSKQTPRIALNRYLQMAYNICSADNRNTITISDIQQTFRLLQVDKLGLDKLEQDYLRELAKSSPAKLNILASALGLPRQTVSDVIEPYLIRQNLIRKEGTSRVITAKGLKHINNNNV